MKKLAKDKGFVGYSHFRKDDLVTLTQWDSLNNKSKKQLQEITRGKNLMFNDHYNKADLISLIQGRQIPTNLPEPI